MKIDAEINGDGFHIWNGQEAHRYQVTLTYGDRTMSLTFHQGLGIDRDPTAADVLYCVLSDYSDAEEWFEHWAEDLGYDPDSRKAEAIFRAVQAQSRQLEQLMGDDLDAIQADLYDSDAEDVAARWAGETR